MSFDGFAQPTMKYLADLAENNDRDWFQANRDRYESSFIEPALAFISAMEPHLESISPYFTALPAKQGGSLMRIYRDVRFSKNKQPYKTNIGIHFRHELARDVHAPGFYLHIQCPDTPSDYETTGPMIGAGVWRPDSHALKAIRQRIVDQPQKWIAARDDPDFSEAFELTGESLKRPPRGFDPDHPHLDDLKRKDFVACQYPTLDQISSPEFIDIAAEAFAVASPFMHFLCKAIGVRF